MKAKRYVVLNGDGGEVSRGKMNQKARRDAVKKGDKVKLLTTHCNILAELARQAKVAEAQAKLAEDLKKLAEEHGAVNVTVEIKAE